MGLAQCPRMTRLADTFSVTTAVNWFEIFLATLDCYVWVYGQDLLRPQDVFKGTLFNH